MIYLARPYSHPDPRVREGRFRAVTLRAARLLAAGEMVFSPITLSHPIALHGLKGDWEFWSRYDSWYLVRCTQLFILSLAGWRQSVGVTAERRLALQLKKPVRLLRPTPRERALARAGFGKKAIKSVKRGRRREEKR